MCVMSIPCLFSLLLPSSSSRRIRRESPVSWCWWKRGERFLCPFISRLSLVFPLVVLYPMTFPCWCSLWTHPAFLTLLSFLSLDLFIALYFCKKNSWPLPNPLPFKQNVTDLFQSFVFPFFGLKSDRFSFLFPSLCLTFFTPSRQTGSLSPSQSFSILFPFWVTRVLSGNRRLFIETPFSFFQSDIKSFKNSLPVIKSLKIRSFEINLFSSSVCH